MISTKDVRIDWILESSDHQIVEMTPLFINDSFAVPLRIKANMMDRSMKIFAVGKEKKRRQSTV